MQKHCMSLYKYDKSKQQAATANKIKQNSRKNCKDIKTNSNPTKAQPHNENQTTTFKHIAFHKINTT